MLPVLIQRELAKLYGEQYLIESVLDRGLSHAVVFRIETRNGSYALKRHPLVVSRDRVLVQHQFQTYLCQSGFQFIPQLQNWTNGSTLIEEDRSFWEMSTWRPGTPLEHVGEVSDMQLRESIEVVAKIHTRSRAKHAVEMIPPGITERERKLYHFLNNSQFHIQRFLNQFHATSETDDAYNGLQDIFRISTWLAPLVLRQLYEISDAPQTCMWIIRDFWRNHLLFVGERLNGVIDFGASRIDSPWFDLSRMLGTLMMDSDPRWEAAIDGYNSLCSARTVDVKQIRFVHRISTLISGLNWLDWLANGNFELSDGRRQPLLRILEVSRQLRDIELHWAAGS